MTHRIRTALFLVCELFVANLAISVEPCELDFPFHVAIQTHSAENPFTEHNQNNFHYNSLNQVLIVCG